MSIIKSASHKLAYMTVFLVVLLAACGQPVESVPTDEAIPGTEEALPVEPVASEQLVTQIAIDGDPADWKGYDVLVTDPEGDHQGGGFDVAQVSAFTNDQFLYILIETYGPAADYEQIDLDLHVGERNYVVSINPRDGSTGWMGDITGGDWKDLGEIVDWHSAAGEAIEYKMPLSYIDNKTEIKLAVFPMGGECCDYPAWYRIDEINPVNVPATDEAEYGETTVAVESEPTITQITIDGDPSDWAERPILKDDPVGDNEVGTLDLTALYAFRNQNAIYLMLTVDDPISTFAEVNFIFRVGEKLINVSWKGHSKRAFMMANERPDFLGDTGYSIFVLGSVLEARIDLRDIGQAEDVELQTIDVMTGPPWSTADNFQQPLIVPTVHEADPSELLARIPPYVLADWMELPAGWQIENVFTPPLPDIFQLTASKNGTIYVEQHSFTSAISTIDPETGAVKRVIELPWEPGRTVGIAGGPGDTVFRVVRNEIWQIKPDGSHEVWGNVIFGEGTHPTYYAENGQLIGFKHGNPGCVIELLPDATTRDLACGFKEIWDVIADKDGTLYVSDWITGQVTRVNPDGSRQVLADKVIYRDPIDLGFNSAGELFMSVADQPFQRWDSIEQKFIPLNGELTECAFHAADFEFAGDSRVLFIDPTWSMVTWADIDTTSSGVLIGNEGANTRASAIGPDNALYYATTGCRGNPPAQIMRVEPNKPPTVVVSDLPDSVFDLAFSPDGGMYLLTWEAGLANNSLYYVAPGSGKTELIPSPEDLDIRDIAVLSNGNMIGWVHRTNRLVEFSPQGYVKDILFNPPELIEIFSIDYAPDGYLYGFAELARGDRKGPMVYRQLLRIDLGTGKAKIIYQNDIERALAGGSLDVAPDGSFWIILFPDFEIYHILADGTATRIAKELPVDSWRVNVDNSGNVYFNSPSGIYRIYQTP
ncbi:MAG: hypothetical protein ACOYYU_02970 [Chloroflexota bacterium]